MRLLHLVLIAFVVFVLAVAGYLYLPKPPSLEAETVLSQTGKPLDIEAAAKRLRGFNLLSSNPPAPDTLMYDINGQASTLQQFKGKLVLLNLWATWCPPCIREMPDLNDLAEQYKNRGFVVVPIASGRQGQEEPSEFLRSRSLDHLSTYYDPGSELLKTLGLDSLPTTFVIDRSGNLRGGVIGILDWGSTDAKNLIEAFLGEQET